MANIVNQQVLNIKQHLEYKVYLEETSCFELCLASRNLQFIIFMKI